MLILKPADKLKQPQKAGNVDDNVVFLVRKVFNSVNSSSTFYGDKQVTFDRGTANENINFQKQKHESLIHSYQTNTVDAITLIFDILIIL